MSFKNIVVLGFPGIVRIGILITSGLYIWMIWIGSSILPRWMVVFNPILLVVSSFGLYLIFPVFGGIIAPIAMNTAHIILFALTTGLSIRYFKNQSKSDKITTSKEILNKTKSEQTKDKHL